MAAGDGVAEEGAGTAFAGLFNSGTNHAGTKPDIYSFDLAVGTYASVTSTTICTQLSTSPFGMRALSATQTSSAAVVPFTPHWDDWASHNTSASSIGQLTGGNDFLCFRVLTAPSEELRASGISVNVILRRVI